MKNEIMGKITISLSNECEKRLREQAKTNMRSISKEVEFLVTHSKKV